MIMSRLIIALAIVLVLVLVIVLYRGELFARKNRFASGSGPYSMQLYDSPRYYPFYEGREYTKWDRDGRCATYCRASGDGGCAVVCR